MSADAWVAGAIFTATYVLLAVEPFDRTLIALLAGVLVIGLGIVDQAEAFAGIDLNVIFLLLGMMVIAGGLSRTGFFEWLAVRSVRMSHGHPMRLLVILSAVTALISTVLPNVTAVVLTTPVILSVARRLGISPLPYLVATVLASNIGGTATLIGDPPNILIGSASGLGFADFALNLGPVTILVFIAYVAIMAIVFRNHLQVPTERREAAVEATESVAISNPRLLALIMAVASLTLVGFVLEPSLGIEPATVALLGASVVMLIGRFDPHELLRDVDWSTLLFFVGLFVLVEAIVHVGLVDSIAQAATQLTGGSPVTASIGLLWFSGIISALVDNIPYTATAIPIVEKLISSGLPSNALWWSLALGACLGGNLTILGASSNVVVVNLARRAGHPIGFFQFLGYGAAVVGASLAISTVWIWLVYLN